MGHPEEIGLTARDHFEGLWKLGDPWSTDSSEFEQAKYLHEFGLINGRRYRHALEIGCGSGSFTRLLSTITERVVALDIAESAIARARQAVPDAENVEFRVESIMEWDPASEGRWDLITVGDTIAAIGWLYSFLDIAWLAARLFAATEPGGHLLVADTCGGVRDSSFRPWLIRTYRDLFRNVGYEVEAEELFRGVKDDTEISVLMSVFHKSPEDAAEREAALW